MAEVNKQASARGRGRPGASLTLGRKKLGTVEIRPMLLDAVKGGWCWRGEESPPSFLSLASPEAPRKTPGHADALGFRKPLDSQPSQPTGVGDGRAFAGGLRQPSPSGPRFPYGFVSPWGP